MQAQYAQHLCLQEQSGTELKATDFSTLEVGFHQGSLATVAMKATEVERLSHSAVPALKGKTMTVYKHNCQHFN